MYNLYKEYLEYFDLLDNQILLRSRDRKLEEANKKYENLINETKESIIKYSQLKFHEDISSSINTLSKYQIFDLLDHLYDFKEFEELKKHLQNLKILIFYKQKHNLFFQKQVVYNDSLLLL